MVESEDLEFVQRLSNLAGIPMSEERARMLAGALPLVRQGTEALAAFDLGERQPALVFCPPPAKERPSITKS